MRASIDDGGGLSTGQAKALARLSHGSQPHGQAAGQLGDGKPAQSEDRTDPPFPVTQERISDGARYQGRCGEGAAPGPHP